MENRNLPAISRSQKSNIVSKIRNFFYRSRDFTVSDYINGLAALSLAFFRSYPIPAIGAFMTFVLAGGLATGFSTPVSSTKVVIVKAKTAADTFVEETVLTCEGSKPAFMGNDSEYKGEVGGTELTPESFPPPKEEAHPTTVNRKGDELSPEQYINRYSSIAVKQMKKFGIPASITLAQGIIESRSGNSTLAKVANNHFGIKCFAKRHKACCVKSYDDSNADSFVIFDSPEAAFKAHSQFLQKDRYKRLKKYGRNYQQWAYGLKACGYATDKTYGPKLISIIKRHNLARFDR
jgi:Mannosyl-glycoprotein endo-beta-N-acetylglucosaminidase